MVVLARIARLIVPYATRPIIAYSVEKVLCFAQTVTKLARKIIALIRVAQKVTLRAHGSIVRRRKLAQTQMYTACALL
jgi:membrane protein YdbS with pleckstrin-like domain